MKIGAVVGVVVVTAAVGLVVGIWIGGQRGDLVRDDVSEVERLQTELEDAQAAEALLREEVENIRVARSAIEEERDGLKAKLSEMTAKAAPAVEEVEAPSAPDDDGKRFFLEEYDGALAEVDWKVVGTNMKEMAELIPGVIRDLSEGRPPQADAIGRIQQLNGPLLATAIKLNGKVPGTGVNGSFSSPAFMVNAMASTLEAAGLPLSDDQARNLRAVAREYMDKDAKRLEGYLEDTFAVTQLVDEAELKAEFFAEAFRVMTTPQLAVLSPPDTRDRVRADIFSSSLLYANRVDVVKFQKREDLASTVVSRAVARLQLTEEERERIQPTVEGWVNSLPAELIEKETDLLDRQGLLKVDRVNAWGHQMVPLLQGLIGALGLNEQRSAGVRHLGAVLVGIKVAS